jgi:hypothetical protein
LTPRIAGYTIILSDTKVAGNSSFIVWKRRANKLPRVVQGPRQRGPWPPFLLRDHYRGPCGTRTSSSSGGTMTVGPCRTGTASSSGRTTVVTRYDNEISSSPMHIRFTLGTSSSPLCTIPNSSFILSNGIHKTAISPNSLILERHVSAFLRKKGRPRNLPIGMVGPVRCGANDMILEMKPWLGFRRGADRACVGTNE